MEVPERSSLEPMPYVMHTRLELEAVVETSGEQCRRLHARPGPLQSITAQGAGHKLCMLGAPCVGGLFSHRANLHAQVVALGHE